MSWPEDMDMLWIKFLRFVSVFCSADANISCSMRIPSECQTLWIQIAPLAPDLSTN